MQRFEKLWMRDKIVCALTITHWEQKDSVMQLDFQKYEASLSVACVA